MRFSWGLILLLILDMGPLNAFWWTSQGVTDGPTVDKDSSDSGMTSEDKDIGDVGSNIIDVARGIQGFVQNWDEDPTVKWNSAVTWIPDISSKDGHSKRGNDKYLSEKVKHEINVKGSSGDARGSGLGSGPTLDLALEGIKTTNHKGTWVTDSRISIISTTTFPKDSTNCLPRGSDWPFCISHGEAATMVWNGFFAYYWHQDAISPLKILG
ncbi:hypothetical protein F2P79_024297 [Pimephales promelas]|nr:hypothetical protein F2P79_024297 [Pimephales promelas]